MAYANYLASVEWSEIESLRSGEKATMAVRTTAVVSHLLADAVKDQRLRGCLADIIDKGEVLSPSLWHPLRAPVVHSPQAVSALATMLRSAIESLDSGGGYGLDYEITAVLRVLSDAAENNCSLVSVLEPPADAERAQLVACPFGEPEKLPIPWGNLGKLKRFLKS